MEAVVVDQSSISGYNKQIRTPKKNTRSHGSKPIENIAPANMYGSVLFHFPQSSLSYSYPPLGASSSYSSILSRPYQQEQNPPLLPLPVPLSSRTRGLSCPPTPRKTNRSGRHSVTPRKPKSRPSPKKDDKSKPESLIIASTNRLGPDPNDLPKDVPKALSSSYLSTSKSVCSVMVADLDKFSGSVYSLAPPPSSLPLPRFSLRPKLSCNAEAAGIDAGATDNLRRILRLR